MMISRHGCRTRSICRRIFLPAWECGMNPSPRIAPPPKLHVVTLPCGIATLAKPKSYTRSTTWPTPICRKLRMPKRRRSSSSLPKYARRIRNWISWRPMRWLQFQRGMPSNGTIGRQQQTSQFQMCRTGRHFLSWKRSLNMVTPSDAPIQVTSMAREQLGTLLLETGQPKEAQREFEVALKIYPGRFRGLYGAAQAAELAGDNQGASRYYTKLAAQTSKADDSRSELNHVREFLSAQSKAADASGVASARE